MSKHDIECRAADVLVGMEGNPLYRPMFPLDVTRVAEFLALDVVWDCIPDDDQGAIAARILPIDRLIEINETVLALGQGFEASTVAHEIGHWVLHIEHSAVERYSRLRERGLDVAIAPLLCRSEEQAQGIEWQAQYFASCLLMPRDVLQEQVRGRDLSQWCDLYAIAESLGVTISNLIHRLKDLGWLRLEAGSPQGIG
ncbi:ImmA/IrrE family metallo-endopeptidase [Spirulina subsalsa FACHB-351]|uniref:ImmA/IrrE family metallo-endopeptidase n=2 Tax=Spirulina subsalsa TaxID=54311 RepID=A0ABT3L7Z6_9CYAN|nr:ImmA/IrrE family metallo-endopeptidase [Spirulina subsalsa FACHB-351]